MTPSASDTLTSSSVTVHKRDGTQVEFVPDRIFKAIEYGFRDVFGISESAELPAEHKEAIETVGQAVVDEVTEMAGEGASLDVECIQDRVEAHLMAQGHYKVAKSYIVYREEHKKQRLLKGDEAFASTIGGQVSIELPDGSREALDAGKIRRSAVDMVEGYEETCDASEIADEVLKTLYDGVKPSEIQRGVMLAARARVEKDPAYSRVAARVLLDTVYKEALGDYTAETLVDLHRSSFPEYIALGVGLERLDPVLLEYDLAKLGAALKIERDQQFQYLGIQTVYDRYLIHHEEKRIETPQYFWMRVAMGLALNEDKREERAIEFYNVLSQFLFVSSTPTLFNSGTLRPQLSSCYLSTVNDDLDSIFHLITCNAKLSKWAGGLGNDWTNVRATNAYIKGTNGKSQGVIPFLKVANDTAVAVNQGGKRKGALCSYIETWHLDIEDFLELRKNTGDERRRTHDMNTANWIPDLFMKRVSQNGMWTLFSPDEVPELHDLYGKAFEAKYEEYEAKAERGEMRQHKTIAAADLWRRMITLLFETGHPWITFKDPSNIRSPQDHAGVVHSSNLCTEILLNTSKDETAVCNLGSVNLVAHVSEHGMNEELVASTVKTAIRMLDNVIDINFYPTEEAATSNKRHRPIGLGTMGFQDALYTLGISYASKEAIAFADASMEMISYYAILSSSELAAEREPYSSFDGSKWDRGLLPIDTIELLAQERDGDVDVDRTVRMDWSKVRKSVAKNGMRNSNTMAIAPTATIANIVGVSQSIEPTYKNLYSKSNLSGDFIVVNIHLVEDLKARGLWDDDMVDDLKYYDGSLQEIERVPDDLKAKYLTAFEISSKWLVECASRRQKWIDMGQSLNLYIAEPDGKTLNDMYLHAWRKGLKTTYYLRAMAATQVEKSTQDINKRGMQPRWMKSKSASSDVHVERETPKACSILDPDCEACQ